MQSERVEASRKRRRPPKACEQCRRSKIRCNQDLPCDQCVRLKVDGCSYDPQTLLARAAQRSKHGREPVVDRSPLTPASIVDQNGLTRQSNNSAISLASSLAQNTLIINAADTTATAKPHHDPTELLEDRLLHVAHESGGHSDVPASHDTLHGIVTKTRLLGRSHWMNLAHEFSFVKDIQNSMEAGDFGEAKMLLDRCKILGRSIKSQNLRELKPLTNLREFIPARVVADVLVNNYLYTFESCYRILHIPSFRREYEQFWSNADLANPAFITKLLLVLSIGARVGDEESIDELHVSALQWINTAHSWLGSPFTEKTRLSIAGIQIHCLLLLAREVNSVSADLIWISAGSLLREATMIGLHRDPSHFPRLTAYQSEVRRRLWVTVMEICLQSAMNAGGSPMISVETHDCQPPSNLDDEDLNEETGFVASPMKESIFTQTSLQIALVQTMPLRLRIASMLNDFRSEQSFSDTLQIGSKLTSLLHQLSSRLRTGQSNNTSCTNDSNFAMYELMTYRFIINLHQTFAIRAMVDPMFYFSRKVCFDTSLFVCSVALPALPMQAKKTDLLRILEATGGSWKNAVMTAIFSLILELTTQLKDTQAAPTNVSDDAIRREIFRILEAYTEWTLNRIKKGETNIKGYVFGSCGLAHMKAWATHGSTQTIVVETGKRALESCVDILQKRLNDCTTPKLSNTFESEQSGDDPGMPFPADFGWSDWDPDFDIGSTDFFFPST